MASMTIEQALALGLDHHRSGRVQQAETVYREILKVQPRHADALHLLGILAHQCKQPDVAIDLIRQAIAERPNFGDFHSNLGEVLRTAGRKQEALEATRRAVELNPQSASSLYNHGLCLYQLDKIDDAIGFYNRSLAIDPRNPDCLTNMGAALQAQKKPEEAVKYYNAALALGPQATTWNNLAVLYRDKKMYNESIQAAQRALAISAEYPEAFNNLGLGLNMLERKEEAIAYFQKAIAVKPDFAEGYNNIGSVYREMKKYDVALEWHQKALAVRPTFHEAYAGMGNVYTETNRLDESIAVFQKAVDLKPDYGDGWNNMAVAYAKKNDIKTAVECLTKAIELRPDYADAHCNRGILYLQLGEFDKAWPDYAYRWKASNFPTPRDDFAEPMWDGGDLSGKTILLHAEQGFGDTIQFLRYVPLVLAKGARIVVETHEEVRRLAERVPGISEFVTRGDPLPKFDVQCSLLTLPEAFKTNLERIPPVGDVITADPVEVEKWRARLEKDGPGLRIGIGWAGRPTHLNDHNRSMKLEQFAAFSKALPGAIFYSLQKGEAAAQVKTPPAGMRLIDYSEELKDFADSAALVQNLDLVLSVDTAVVHLAGMLHKPVWVLLPFSPDWRWLMEREDTPWYPTMRLFRQTAVGKWDDVIEKAAHQLAGWGQSR